MLNIAFKIHNPQYQQIQLLMFVKMCLYNCKLSIGIEICLILFDTIACVSKFFLYLQ
jgi:hypothetical protein